MLVTTQHLQRNGIRAFHLLMTAASERRHARSAINPIQGRRPQCGAEMRPLSLLAAQVSPAHETLHEPAAKVGAYIR